MNVQNMVHQVIIYMLSRAELQPGGSAVFYGSPRQFMETVSMSSGNVYNRLYELGFVRQGQGRKAKWTIPADFTQYSA